MGKKEKCFISAFDALGKLLPQLTQFIHQTVGSSNSKISYITSVCLLIIVSSIPLLSLTSLIYAIATLMEKLGSDELKERFLDFILFISAGYFVTLLVVFSIFIVAMLFHGTGCGAFYKSGRDARKKIEDSKDFLKWQCAT